MCVLRSKTYLVPFLKPRLLKFLLPTGFVEKGTEESLIDAPSFRLNPKNAIFLGSRSILNGKVSLAHGFEESKEAFGFFVLLSTSTTSSLPSLLPPVHHPSSLPLLPIYPMTRQAPPELQLWWKWGVTFDCGFNYIRLLVHKKLGTGVYLAEETDKGSEIYLAEEIGEVSIKYGEPSILILFLFHFRPAPQNFPMLTLAPAFPSRQPSK